MSIRVMSKVWDGSKQSEGALLVLLSMADHADDGGVCFPSQERLAQRARLSVRQVRRVIDRLVMDEEVKVLREGVGRGKRSVYKILVGCSQLKEDNMSAFTENGLKADIGDTKKRTLATRSIIKEPSVEPPSLHATFISLWMAAYLEHFKCVYAFQRGKDAKSVQHLLAASHLLPAELITIAQAAWKNASGFYCKSATSITGFYSKFNEIRQELKHGTNKKSTPALSRNVGTANEGKSEQYRGVGRIQSV